MASGRTGSYIGIRALRALALEVSGKIEGNPSSRLEEKKRQVAACTLPALKLAVVVGFDKPVLMAGDA